MKIREVEGYGRPINKSPFCGSPLGLHQLSPIFGENSPLSYIVVLPGRRSTIGTFEFLVDLHSLCCLETLLNFFLKLEVVRSIVSSGGRVVHGCVIGPLDVPTIEFYQ